jgi:hypothetical protein
MYLVVVECLQVVSTSNKPVCFSIGLESELLAANPEVSGSIPDATTFSE